MDDYLEYESMEESLGELSAPLEEFEPDGFTNDFMENIPGGLLCEIRPKNRFYISRVFTEITGYTKREIRSIKCWNKILWSEQGSEV